MIPSTTSFNWVDIFNEIGHHFKEIKLINPGIRVLFLSGFNAEHFAEDNELEQGAELLTKPFKPFDLAEKIRNLLDLDASSHCDSVKI